MNCVILFEIYIYTTEIRLFIPKMVDRRALSAKMPFEYITDLFACKPTLENSIENSLSLTRL